MNLHRTLRYLLLALLATAVWTGCDSTRKLGKNTKVRSADELIRQLTQNQLNAEWLDARARIAYADEDMSVRGSAIIRWQRDSLLWMSVRKLGFEVARVQITPDSVYVIDRINNEYGKYGLDYIQSAYNLPANFHMLQTIILGDAWFPSSAQPELEATPEAYYLTDRSPTLELKYQIHSATFRLLQMAVNEPISNRSVNLELGEYQEVNQQLFSYLRNLTINSPESGAITMNVQFSDVTLNVPKPTRFDIPERYTRME